MTSVLFPGTPNRNTVTTRRISSAEAQALELSLKEDGVDYLYSASVSLGDALGGITRGLFTWATVKLYYSTFYAARARLALKGICLFYVKTSALKTSAFSLYAQAGQLPCKVANNTHKVVLDLFERYNIDPFLTSQPIGMDNPLQWLMNRREEANYKEARFVEPDVPKHFLTISKVGVRSACQSYVVDDKAVFMFDPDHAILAYPLEMMKRSYADFHKYGLSPQKREDKAFFRKLISDKNGPLPYVLNIFAASH